MPVELTDASLGERLYDFRGQIIVMLVAALVIKPFVYYQFGLYRRVWVYASVQELKLIALSVTSASIIITLVVILISNFLPGQDFSRGIFVIDWLLSFLAVGGIRFTQRILTESLTTSHNKLTLVRRVLIVGAGDAGALVAREMQRNKQSNLEPISFVDDDPEKQKQVIHNIPVVGSLNDISRVVVDERIDEVIMAIPSAPGQVVRRVTDVCRSMNIPFRTMPSLSELIGGKISVNRLREVDITDLLRRSPARIDDELVGTSLCGKRVLITGAGGSIGRELCRQVARWEPSHLVLLGHGENSIFETFLELKQSNPDLKVFPAIADIRNQSRLEKLIQHHQPQVIFHAAAHKHVPLMQINIEEAISNNVLGTQNLVENAVKYDVERLVMISTDKAICPTSVYGATKRLGEMIVLETARRESKSFSVVRFGNVLGSRGSVVLLFRHQIHTGGPVTVTHPDMERYFMTIPEAVHLVLQAFAMGRGGEVFVLNMGEQIRILDLAQDLIKLTGLEPGKDIDITFTGIRPGEKLREALWDEGENYQPTSHPDILKLDEDDGISREGLNIAIDKMIELTRQNNPTAIVQLLNDVIPGAAVESTPPSDLTAIV